MYQNVTKLFTRKLGLLSPNCQVLFLINLANNVVSTKSDITKRWFQPSWFTNNRKFYLLTVLLDSVTTLTADMAHDSTSC